MRFLKSFSVAATEPTKSVRILCDSFEHVFDPALIHRQVLGVLCVYHGDFFLYVGRVVKRVCHHVCENLYRFGEPFFVRTHAEYLVGELVGGVGVVHALVLSQQIGQEVGLRLLRGA